MAKILIVDQDPANRNKMATLLGSCGFELFEAEEGAEALAIARTKHPDLIIADSLLPSMDGLRFLRHLRADLAIAQTPVILCTAQNQPAEAAALAAQGDGVTSFLKNPCEPEAIMQAVHAILTPVGSNAKTHDSEKPAHFPVKESESDQVKRSTDRPPQRGDELRRMHDRLTAMVEVGLKMGSERDPGRLLQSFCESVREILGARFAVVGIPVGGYSSPGDSAECDVRFKYLLQSGLSASAAIQIGRSVSQAGALAIALEAGCCFRVDDATSLKALGLAPAFPPVSCLLAGAIISPTTLFGWVCLFDKIGESSFSDEDETLLQMLGAQVGRVYENGILYIDMLHHSTQLAREIAERKKAEQEIRKSANLLQTVVDSTTDAIFVKDREGKYLLCNPAAGRFMGHPPAEVVGKSDADFFDDSSHQFLIDHDRQIMDAGLPVTQEEDLTSAGVPRTFLATKAPYKDAAGQVIGMVGISRDITERKRGEERLRQSQALLSDANRIGKMGAWAISFVDKTMAWSEELRGIYGLKEHEAPDLDRMVKLVTSSSRAKVLNAVARCREKGSPFDIEVQTDTFAGERLWARVIGQPVRDQTDAITGMQGAFQNITERKWTEKRLSTQHAVVNILAQANDLAEAAPKILQSICENSEWEVGDLWVVDRKQDQLSLVDMWHAEGLDAAEFQHLSRNILFRKGIGLPGRVWEKGEPLWLGEVAKEVNFPRAAAAAKAGLLGAFGFPIRQGEETVGVAEFFCRDNRPPDKELLEVFRSLGTQIGQFIERKRGESDLRLFRKLIDRTSDGIEVVDPLTGQYIDVNEKTCTSHGYTRAEFLKMKVADVDPIISSIRWDAFIKDGRLSGHHTFESIHRRKDGSVFPTEVNFNTIRLDRDYMVAVVRDITERKRVEEKLRRFNQELETRVSVRTTELDSRTREFETVVRSIPDTVIRIDRKKAVVFFKNSSPEDIPGIEGCSANATRCGKCLLCSVIDEIFRWEQQPNQAKGNGIIELEVSFGVIELRVTALADGDLLVLARDISARRKLEKEILNALNHEKNLSEMKSRFISVASHEFRTPMTAVLGAVDLLQNFNDKLTPAKRTDLLSRIASGANRLKAIVENVLVLSRADAGKLEVVKDPVNLKALFADIVEEAEVGDQTKHIFVLRCFGERQIFSTDKKLLQHIVSNFLSNAIRYSPERSAIRLDLHLEEKQFWFEISDEGIGIPEQDQPHLFEPFYRATNVGEISGTGLGLDIVKRYTELMGGSIKLVSSTPSGTCFRVVIPDA